MGNNKDRLNQRFSQAQNSKSSSVSSVNDGSNSSRLTNYVANKRNEERASAKTKTDDYRTYGYKTQEAYDADVKKYSWANANKGLTYDEVKSRKQTATGDELNYLNQYGTLVGYSSSKDYEDELNDLSRVENVGWQGKLTANVYNALTNTMGIDLPFTDEEKEAFEKYNTTKAYRDELERRKNLYDIDHTFDKYSDIMSAEDFEENSAYKGNGVKVDAYTQATQGVKNSNGVTVLPGATIIDPSHNVGVGKAFGGLAQGVNKRLEDESGKTNTYYTEDTYDRLNNDYYQDIEAYSDLNTGAYRYMNEDELKVFNYLYNRNPEEAQKYLEDMNPLWERRRDSMFNQGINDLADSGALGMAALTAGRVAASVPANMLSAVNIVGGIVGGEYDPYSSSALLKNFVDDSEQAVGQNLNEQLGNPEWAEKMNVDLPSFLYSTGLSSIDSRIGVEVAGAGYSWLMGAGAFQSTARQMAAQGYNNEDIWTMASIAGIAEVVTEHVSLENLDKFIKEGDKSKFTTMLLGVLRQAGYEGSEEVASDLINTIADELYNGKGSELSQKIAQYQEEGMTLEEARKKASEEFGLQLVQSFAGGALSGGGAAFVSGASGYGRTVYNDYNNGSVLKANNNLESITNAMNNVDNTSEAYKYAQKASKGGLENASNIKVGKAYRLLSNQLSSEVANAQLKDVETFVQRMGITENVSETAKAIQDFISNGYSTKGMKNNEVKILANKNVASLVEKIQNGTIQFELANSKEKLNQIKDLKKAETVRTVFQDATKVDKTENGLRIENADGTVNNINNASLNDDEQSIVEFLSDKNEDAQNIFLSNYSSAMNSYSMREYKEDFAEVYKMGQEKADIDLGDLASYAGTLGGSVMDIYKAGMKSVGQLSEQTAKNLDDKMKSFDGTLKGGTFTSNVDESKLTSNQKMLHTYLKALSKLGININVINDSSRDSKNGEFNPGNNTVTINLSARLTEEIFEGETGQYVVSTIAHEMTHWMEQNSPEAYKNLRNIVKSGLKSLRYESGVSEWDIRFDRHYNDAIKKGKSPAQARRIAESEVVARACEDVLNNNTEMTKILEKADKETLKGIRAAIKKFFDMFKAHIDKILGAFKSDAPEAAALREIEGMSERLREAWNEALTQALANVQLAEEQSLNRSADLATDVVNGNEEGATEYLYGETEREDDVTDDVKNSVKLDPDIMKHSIEVSKVKNDIYPDGFYNTVFKTSDGNFTGEELLLRCSELRKRAAKILKIKEAFLPADVEGNIIVDNGSYSKSAEHALICPRSLVNNWFVDQVSEAVGRPLSVDEQIICSEILAGKVGDLRECQYCYVAADRKSYRDYLLKYYNHYMDTYNKVQADKAKYKAEYDLYMQDADHKAFLDEVLAYKANKKEYKALKKGLIDGFIDYLGSSIPNATQAERYIRFVRDGLEGKMSAELADLSTRRVREEKIKEGGRKAEFVSDAQYLAQSASKAKLQRRDVKVNGEVKSLEYVAYNGNIADWEDTVIYDLNQEYGLRMYSDSDYSAQFILEDMQVFTDAAIRGLKVLAYTKDMGFVKTFAPTGALINISCYGVQSNADDPELAKARKEFAKVKNSYLKNQATKEEYDTAYQNYISKINVMSDAMQGAEWSEVQKYRRQFKNVGSVFVANNDDMVYWAMGQDWVDVVIPYHLVFAGAEVAKYFNFKNFSGTQGDKKIKDKWKAELGNKKSISPTEHHNDLNTYERLLAENNLTARFPEFKENPNYMKLVNETRLAYNEADPVLPIFGTTFSSEEESWEEGDDWGVIKSELDKIGVNEYATNKYGLIPGATDEESQRDILNSDLNKAVDTLNYNDSIREYINIGEMFYEIRDKISDPILNEDGMAYKIGRELSNGNTELIDKVREYRDSLKSKRSKVYKVANQIVKTYETLTYGTVLNSSKFKSSEVGVNIKDNVYPFVDWILSDDPNVKKTVETRDSKSLDPYLGMRVGLVETGVDGGAVVRGYATIARRIDYDDPDVEKRIKKFREDEKLHRIDKDNDYDITKSKKGVKYGYVLEDIVAVEPYAPSGDGRVGRLIENHDPYSDTLYSEKLGYHAGDLGKAEPLSEQGYGRGTGHFGTGTYFVSNPEKINGYNSRKGVDAPVESVDFSKYNLYQVANDNQGYKLHNFLKFVDGFYNLSEYEIRNEEDWESRKDNLENAIYDDDISKEDAFKEMVNLFGEYEVGRKVNSNSDIPEDMYVNYQNGEFYMIDQTDYKDVPITYEEAIENIRIDDLFDAVSSDNRYAPRWVDVIERFEETVERDAESLFGLSKEEVYDILDEINEAISNFNGDDSVADSAATRFMKKLGYEGVFVGDTNLDNTEYGSVIYDLKGEDLARKQEIGTARFSDKIKSSDLLEQEARINTENETLKKDVDNFRTLVNYQRTTIKDKDVKNAVRSILDKTSAYITAEELEKELTDLYTYALSPDYEFETFLNGLENIASKVSERATVDEKGRRVNGREYEATAYYRQLLKNLRNTKVSLDAEQLQYAKDNYGSIEENYNDYRNSFFGKVTLAQNGTALEEQWKKWSDKHPEIFNPNATKTEMVDGIIRAYETIQESAEAVTDFVQTETVRENAQLIYEKMWNIARNYNKEDATGFKAEHRDAMKNITESREKALEGFRGEREGADEAYYNRILSRAVQSRDAYIAKLKEGIKNRKEAEREYRERSKYINRIEKISKSLRKNLQEDSAKHNVPNDFKEPVLELLNAIDFSSKRLLGMTGGEKSGTPTKKDISLSASMAKISEQVAKSIEAQKQGDFTLDLPGDYAQQVAELNTKVAKIQAQVRNDNAYIINQMNAQELEDLSIMLETMNNSVKSLTNLIASRRNGTVGALSRMVIRDGRAKNVRANSSLKFVNAVDNFINSDQITPYFFFKHLGEGGMQIFRELQDGFDKYAFNIRNILNYSESNWNGEQVKEWTNTIVKFDDEFDVVKDKKADAKIEMSVPQIMSLYCLLKRDQARKHIFKKGIKLSEFKNGLKMGTQSSTLLNEEQAQKIVSVLTEEQLKVAKAIQYYMNTVCKDWMNEITMKRFGIIGALDENYFPIKTDSYSRDVKPNDNDASGIFRLLNMSFTKKVSENVSNAIIVSDIFSVFTDHATDMAKYNAIALPTLDLIKMLNYRENNADEAPVNLRDELDKAYGHRAVQYITKMLEDLNGSVKAEQGNQILTTLNRNYKIAAVGANLQVAALQPLSLVRAGYVLNPKYIAQGMARRPQIKRVQNECGISAWKQLGFYQINVNRGLEHDIRQDKTPWDKITEMSMKGAEVMDNVTWGYLYNACEEWARGETSFDTNSEEFRQAVNDKFREVVYSTQVVDSTLTRSQYMRKTDWLSKSTSAFMAEPTLTYNMVYDAFNGFITDLRQGKKTGQALRNNGGQIARAVTVFAVSAILESALRGVISMFRDPYDKDDEDDKNLAERMRDNLISELIPFTKIPILKDIVSLLQGYDINRFEYEGISSLATLAKKAYRILDKNDDYSGKMTYKDAYKALQALSQISGMPGNAAVREVIALWNFLCIHCGWDDSKIDL